ncbi:hypothetical protein H2200_006958 [Cladophialophora chaetospira]|uniref:Uncharacterized protein n=1 Tax=Cladophialophora chaetospira TaxID=386627 RepID=A0AA38X965_9EURO|nr:hypothetical protein H2200_006958 [Cladophialophora chaetospira]
MCLECWEAKKCMYCGHYFGERQRRTYMCDYKSRNTKLKCRNHASTDQIMLNDTVACPQCDPDGVEEARYRDEWVDEASSDIDEYGSEPGDDTDGNVEIREASE